MGLMFPKDAVVVPPPDTFVENPSPVYVVSSAQLPSVISDTELNDAWLFPVFLITASQFKVPPKSTDTVPDWLLQENDWTVRAPEAGSVRAAIISIPYMIFSFIFTFDGRRRNLCLRHPNSNFLLCRMPEHSIGRSLRRLTESDVSHSMSH